MLDAQIEKMDENIHDMDPEDFDRIVTAMSEEGLAIRAIRRKIRYNLYRTQTEVLGGAAAGELEGFRAKFEASPGFGGWRFFSVTWDVAMDDPYRIVHRDLSIADEWENLVRAKFPTIEPGTGKISYPDILVKKKAAARKGK